MLVPKERHLILHLLQFDAAVHDTLDKYSPHRLLYVGCKHSPHPGNEHGIL